MTSVHKPCFVAALLLVSLGLGRHARAQDGAATAPAVDSDEQATPAGDAALRTRLAETLLLGQQYSEAIAQFEKALDAEPDNRRARLGLAKAYFWSGRIEQARAALKPSIENRPDAETLALWQEIVSASTSAEGLETLAEFVEADPDNVRLTQSYGRLLTSLGCYAKAIRILDALAQEHPGNVQIAVDLALAYYSADRYFETIEICERFESDTSPAGLRARALLARTLLKMWRISAANEVLVDLRAQIGDEPRVHLGLLLSWVFDPENAPYSADESLDALANPIVRRKLQDRAEAREWLFALVSELVAHVPTDERVEAAERLEQILAWDDPSPAIEIARQVLRQFAENGPEAVVPEVEELVEDIAQGRVAGSELREAATILLVLSAGEPLIEVCDAGLERNPDDVMLMLMRAEGLAITVEYEDAEEAYQDVVEVLPCCTKAKRGLARTYSWHREFKDAEETYEELIEADPTDMVIRREAARSLGWDKQLRLSLESFEDIAEATEGALAGEKWREILIAEREAKKAALWTREYEARKKYKALIEMDPSNLEARFDLAQVYARNRLWEEAAEQYRDILQIDARHRRARDALYKNAIYHEPVSTTSFAWSRAGGYGDLLDIETLRVTEKVQQEIALRTDLSFRTDQMFHTFEHWGGGSIREQNYILRLDHRFGLRTWGHVAGGWALFDDSDDEDRFIASAALNHRIYRGLTLTVGYDREPWRMNRATIEQGIDQDRLYFRAVDNMDPWFDAWFEYGHSWLSDGTYAMPLRYRQVRPDLVYTRDNDLDEIKWGAAYRLSLFPKILQIEYRGFVWMFDHEVPTYFSPDFFMVNILRESWRHYLNNDQYVEMKQFYYEVGLTESIDSEGVAGIGWDAALGWDLCHYFGIELKWSGMRSNTYDQDVVFAQIVARF